MALIGTCVSQCGKNLALQWMYMDMSGNPVNDTCNTCDPVTNPVFLTPVTTFTIAANPLFFEINPSINKFRFRLTGTTETQSSGFAEMVVVLNGPPASGTCTLNTLSLRALIGFKQWQLVTTGKTKKNLVSSHTPFITLLVIPKQLWDHQVLVI
nr:uncharacterized protein LOC128700793 [Cherax quadricarinatus]XP_053650226.1 uncharacterized protein LOC128700793 [Cherax quadricarinatus]